MSCLTRSSRLAAALVTLILAACGDDRAVAADATFCAAMEQVVTLMEPDPQGVTPPEGVRANFDEIVGLLDQAESNAPSAISDDIITFAAAVDTYVTALDVVGYDLDAMFSTAEGTQLALDTSHALTPDVVNHMTGPCAITL